VVVRRKAARGMIADNLLTGHGSQGGPRRAEKPRHPIISRFPAVRRVAG
jgi:hypothetical protein